ncbi:hypothetical protein TNCV_2234131 [Trichonephila clavipes]|nr:hypothetical protein TNCV_2234131 [Trichonephila clavipes]
MNVCFVCPEDIPRPFWINFQTSKKLQGEQMPSLEIMWKQFLYKFKLIWIVTENVLHDLLHPQEPLPCRLVIWDDRCRFSASGKSIDLSRSRARNLGMTTPLVMQLGTSQFSMPIMGSADWTKLPKIKTSSVNASGKSWIRELRGTATVQNRG